MGLSGIPVPMSNLMMGEIMNNRWGIILLVTAGCAMAASHPACLAPTTATSYCSVNAIWSYSTDCVKDS